MFRILIAEDDRNLQRLMEAVLKRNGYEVLSAKDGEEALEIIEVNHIDLLICDIMMPKKDGYELTQELRDSNFELPILMITARETMDDKRKGFTVGTDDYMVKPVDMDEMLLRVAALLRRSKIQNERQLVIGNTRLEWDTLTVYSNDEALVLPKKEFYLLFKLLSYPGQIFTRQQLMDEIWGMDIDTDERTVDVHIKRLRDHFGESDDFKLVTVRGLGYKAQKIV